jgi:hypothetical protein
MATHDYIISNASGAAVRADLNNALAAIATNNSSATEPTTTYAYQWWADTGSSPTVMKLRNSANSAWITLFQLDGEWSLIPFENGTAAAPSIYFKDSGTDTGLFSGGTDQVNITTGGTERVEWGTSEVVFNDSGANYDFRIEGDTNANLFFVDASADAVGIATTSPGARLDVNGKLRLSSTEDNQLEWVSGAQTWRSNVVGGGKWYLYDVTNTKFPLDVFANTTCKLDINTSHVAFTTNSTERARIDSSGRLLVGTSTARSNFFNTTFATSIQLEGTTSVSSSLSLVSNRSTAEQFDQPVLVLGRSGGTAIGNNTVVANTNAVGSISFQGNDGTEFVALAEITAFVDGTPGANDMPGRLVFSTTADGASSPTERMRILSGGGVVIGTTSFAGVGLSLSSPVASGIYSRTDSTGSTNHLRFENPNGVVGSITTNASATAYSTSSDYRLKENVVSVADGITRLQQLKPSRFNFIADPNKTVDGFLAHEVQDVVPEAITGKKDDVDADGNPKYQGIDQSKLVPLLTAALQEAIGRIETLEAEVAALKGA